MPKSSIIGHIPTSDRAACATLGQTALPIREGRIARSIRVPDAFVPVIGPSEAGSGVIAATVSASQTAHDPARPATQCGTVPFTPIPVEGS